MSKGIAITIGLNGVDPKYYSGWSGPLKGCENDARAMDAIARARGFECHLFVTAEATRNAVLGALVDAGKRLDGGDLLYVGYSGHGGQLPDLNGDEVDGWDETWCLHDGDLVDDELCAFWATLAAGVRVLVTADSCHSGTSIRLPQRALRAPREVELALERRMPPAHGAKEIPPAIAWKTYQEHKVEIDKITREIDPKIAERVRASVVLISACQDDEVAGDGLPNSRFTAALLDVWDQGRFKGDLPAFHQAITAAITGQRPNLDRVGPTAKWFEEQPPFTI